MQKIENHVFYSGCNGGTLLPPCVESINYAPDNKPDMASLNDGLTQLSFTMKVIADKMDETTPATTDICNIQQKYRTGIKTRRLELHI